MYTFLERIRFSMRVLSSWSLPSNTGLCYTCTHFCVWEISERNATQCMGMCPLSAQIRPPYPYFKPLSPSVLSQLPLFSRATLSPHAPVLWAPFPGMAQSKDTILCHRIPVLPLSSKHCLIPILILRPPQLIPDPWHRPEVQVPDAASRNSNCCFGHSLQAPRSSSTEWIAYATASPTVIAPVLPSQPPRPI